MSFEFVKFSNGALLVKPSRVAAVSKVGDGTLIWLEGAPDPMSLREKFEDVCRKLAVDAKDQAV